MAQGIVPRLGGTRVEKIVAIFTLFCIVFIDSGNKHKIPKPNNLETAKRKKKEAMAMSKKENIKAKKDWAGVEEINKYK